MQYGCLTIGVLIALAIVTTIYQISVSTGTFLGLECFQPNNPGCVPAIMPLSTLDMVYAREALMPQMMMRDGVEGEDAVETDGPEAEEGVYEEFLFGVTDPTLHCKVWPGSWGSGSASTEVTSTAANSKGSGSSSADGPEPRRVSELAAHPPSPGQWDVAYPEDDISPIVDSGKPRPSPRRPTSKKTSSSPSAKVRGSPSPSSLSSRHFAESLRSHANATLEVTWLWDRVEQSIVNVSAGAPAVPSFAEYVKSPQDFAPQLRSQMQAFIASAPKYPGPKAFRSAGIVMVAGGVKYMPAAYISIRLLRHVKCTLPIELWHSAQERPTPALRTKLFCKYGVLSRCIDDIAPAVFGGFGLKIAALLFTQFELVLFMDADNHVIRDPTFLLMTPQFERTGLLLWPDLWYYKANDLQLFWDLVGKSYKANQPFPAHESGQMVLDKKRMWPMLMLVLFWTHQYRLYFRLTVPNAAGIGDKELFPLACQYLDLAYHLIEYPPAVAGSYSRIRVLRGAGQRPLTDPNGAPLTSMLPAPAASTTSERLSAPAIDPSKASAPTTEKPNHKASVPQAYSYFRFEFVRTRPSDAVRKMVQISEVTFFDNDRTPLPKVGSVDLRAVISPTGLSPVNQRPSSAYDNNLQSKWLHVMPLPALWIIRYDHQYTLKEYRIFTADDDPTRDPISWVLSGSNDGATWIKLHAICNYPTTNARKAMMGPFVIGEPSINDCTSTAPPSIPASMQVATSTNDPPAGQELNPLMLVTKRVQGHTQVQHGPNGQLLFLHRNCHKITLGSQPMRRVWEGMAFHTQSYGILVAPRAVVLRDELVGGRSECRFALVNPDVTVDFVKAMPFDVEVLIREFVEDLQNDPDYLWFQRLRVFRFKERA